MADPRVETVARVLVDYSVHIQPGELVVIRGAPEGAPLIREVYRRVLERGAHPYTTISLEGLGEIFFKYASDAQLDYVPNVERQLVEDANARISVWTEVNTKAFTNIDPAKQARAGAARRPLMQRFLERAAKKELKWTGTAYPTNAFAQDAEMSLSEF